jgi:23S rRNA (uracil1939-C5)-methyltransferase
VVNFDINAIRLAVRDYAIDKGLSFFDLRQQTGFLRTLMIRITLTGEVMVVVVFAHDNPEAGEDDAARKALLDYLQQTFPQITSLHYIINTKRNDSLGDQETIHYRENLILWKRWKTGIPHRPQSSTDQQPAAFRIVQKNQGYADLQGDETVYVFTRAPAPSPFSGTIMPPVTGVEYVPEAIEDARENASANNNENVRFYAGDMKDVLTADFIAAQGHRKWWVWIRRVQGFMKTC